MIPGVILVDDSEADRYLTRRAILRSGICNRTLEFDSGEQLLALLDDRERLRDEAGDTPPPILVLLDINMPGMTGFDVLDVLKQRFETGRSDSSCMIIMMFTSSSHPGDRARASSYGFVRDYLVKPASADQLKKAVGAHYGAQ